MPTIVQTQVLRSIHSFPLGHLRLTALDVSDDGPYASCVPYVVPNISGPRSTKRIPLMQCHIILCGALYAISVRPLRAIHHERMINRYTLLVAMLAQFQTFPTVHRRYLIIHKVPCKG